MRVLQVANTVPVRGLITKSKTCAIWVYGQKGIGMTYLYDFFLYQGTLFLDLWIENKDGSIEYWGGVSVDNIAHGFRVIENYKKYGNTIKRMF